MHDLEWHTRNADCVSSPMGSFRNMGSKARGGGGRLMVQKELSTSSVGRLDGRQLSLCRRGCVAPWERNYGE